MTDSLNEIAKILSNQRKTSDQSLKRLHEKKYKIERANDIFDPDNSFRMEFFVDKNLNTTTLDLVFKPPVPSSCCAGNMCSQCEIFNAGEEFIQLERDYVPGSVTVRINGRIRTEFTETDPAAGTVTINLSIPAGTTVRVCYIYGSVSAGANDPAPGIPTPPTPGVPGSPGGGSGGGGGVGPPPTPPYPIVPVPPPVTPPPTDESGSITVTQNNVTIEGRSFSSAQLLGSAISAQGTVGSPITGLTIRNCVFKGFRLVIYMRFVNNFLIENNTIEDADYVGIAGFSCGNGIVRNNTIRRIGMTKDPVTGFQGSNTYGIMFNRTESNSLITDPVSHDIDIIGNLVEDVPLWMGINLHAGTNIRIMNNTIRRCPRAIFIAGSPFGGEFSGGGVAPPINITVSGNKTEQAVTKSGGTTDIEGVLYAGVNTISITSNIIGASYGGLGGINQYGSSSTNVTISGNIASGL